MTTLPARVGAARPDAGGAVGTSAPLPPKKRSRRTSFGTSQWVALAFVAPLIAYLIIFYAFPLYRNIELSLHDYTPRAFVQGNAAFVGIENYVAVFGSKTFAKALTNTALFTVVSIAFQFGIGLILAVFFRNNFRLNGVLRGLFLVPWLLPLIVSASTWSSMMNSDNGVINSALSVIGVAPVNWLTSPDLVLASVIIANIWLGIPFNLVVLYSGLQNIPEDLYEAASLDGANAWQKFWRITFPLLRPVSLITILLGLIYTLKVVDIIWIMTAGGPGDSSTTFATWSYREAFGTGNPDFSPAAAVGNVLILIALIFGFIYLRIQNRTEK
ncbi:MULTISPECIES: carbohydrate ABC transporter permease [Cryobacterium]|uniref:Sugar ABC transporter permease n=1 Tax=Cryobacterium glucosi TaxID=1259175 RepID=A0ABY2IMN1_9MICO|nr:MULTISPECIES: sugar ABC transporter permease [Cryobacterium]MDY7526974.1 sugar ABC transporter permease [Cryobacterium sp. 10C2]MEB0002304.1 sugar ABC transporter permease [Cryobacterium sp. RTC2.1]MEB0201196.1 sugar ABC transporter permease [Cryobacterium sp. 5I3]MEB0287464.1 sugar ABC transporter permease [Cryobacterium sp. 10S3]MEB0290377.1 sugar ABC transporter permease [Cryobacterium sp. 10C2]